jgi:hypothetical protein
MRGRMSRAEYDNECQMLRQYLAREGHAHFTEFLGAWRD